jgi:hypothetical protein
MVSLEIFTARGGGRRSRSFGQGFAGRVWVGQYLGDSLEYLRDSPGVTAGRNG